MRGYRDSVGRTPGTPGVFETFPAAFAHLIELPGIELQTLQMHKCHVAMFGRQVCLFDELAPVLDPTMARIDVVPAKQRTELGVELMVDRLQVLKAPALQAEILFFASLDVSVGQFGMIERHLGLAPGVEPFGLADDLAFAKADVLNIAGDELDRPSAHVHHIPAKLLTEGAGFIDHINRQAWSVFRGDFEHFADLLSGRFCALIQRSFEGEIGLGKQMGNGTVDALVPFSLADLLADLDVRNIRGRKCGGDLTNGG